METNKVSLELRETSLATTTSFFSTPLPPSETFLRISSESLGLEVQTFHHLILT